jgi:hypothetical protein
MFCRSRLNQDQQVPDYRYQHEQLCLPKTPVTLCHAANRPW